MRVATLAPVAVGIVRLAGTPAVIVAKTTYAIERATTVLLPNPQPISRDRWSEPGSRELTYASDLTPAKQGVDVLLVGHAKSEQARTRIEIRATLGNLRLSLVAVSPRPIARIPLTLECLREPTMPSKKARTAPVRTAREGSSIVSAPASIFNVAPIAHRLDTYQGGLLKVGGLLRDGATTRIQMPRETPRVVLRSNDEAATADPIAMRCDTIWFDTDEPCLVLVFRGSLPRELPANPYVLVTLGAAANVPSDDQLRRQPELANWTVAIEADAEEEVEVPPRQSPAFDRKHELRSTHVEEGKTLRTQASKLLAAAAAQAATTSVTAETNEAKDAEEEGRTEDTPDTGRARARTVVMDRNQIAAFGTARTAEGVDLTVSHAPESVGRPARQSDADEHTHIMMQRAAADAGPKSTGVPPPGSMRLSTQERRALEQAGTMVAASPASQIAPPASSHAAPTSNDPPTMRMMEYARLLARLERSTNQGFLLRQHHLTRDEWTQVQRAWNRLSRDDPKVARALRRALADARSKANADP